MADSHTPVTGKIGLYLEELFSAEDDFFTDLRTAALDAGFPNISIGGVQGAFLQMLLRSMNAKFVVEIGSLFGYSAFMMARALPDDGKVFCFELEEQYAEFIRIQAQKAGLSHKIEVLVGNAADILPNFRSEADIDFAFIDADKPNYISYLEALIPLIRKNGIIAGDNCLAWGNIADSEFNFEPKNVEALQQFNRVVSSLPGFQSCFVPLGDGMAMALKL